jgi:hypothetical protein
MSKNFSLIFGGIIAYILLALYAVTLIWMILQVLDAGSNNGEIEFNSGIIYVVTTVGGLVSALVVAKLTITQPGENPGLINITGQTENKVLKTTTFLTNLYLAVWILVGLSALIVGVMIYPDTNNTISDIGTTWLGLAVSSGYAYFGIKPGK